MLDRQTAKPVNHEALISELAGLSTQFDILRFLKKTTEMFGARAFMVLRVPSSTAVALQSASVITSWPSELIAKYDAEGLLADSPAVRHIKTSTVPFSYDIHAINHQRRDGKSERVVELFEQYGLIRGAYFPVSDAGGDRGAIGYSGTREPFTNQEMLQLHMISTCVFDRLYQLARKDRKGGEDLTQREIDCLTWTAAGKTSLEISNILNLSEHTVNHYLNRATKKLDTVNRTQAVAKALRMGIIS